MAMVDMRDLLRHAYDNGYAVGAFDVIGLEQLEGIIAAAERCRAPVILGMAEPQFERYDFALLAPAVETAARRASVPVAIHFDHGSGVESVLNGMRHGCNGVMIDASHYELRENINRTKAVVEVAHACGVPVEAELGYVPDDAGDELVFTTVEEARGFVRLTEADFLAVSIGTTHGRLKGKPRLDYQRLRHINEALQMPLVLHGSSGLSDDQFRRLIANGVAKVNYFTALTDVAAQRLRKNVRNTDGGYLELLAGVREVVENEVERCMRVWGSAGRAAEVLAQCRPWYPVERLMIFNAPGEDLAEVELVMSRLRNVLEGIPGVREVSPGYAIQEAAGYHFALRVRFVNETAIEPFQHNTDYLAVMNRHFRTIATDSIAVDYQFGSPAEASPPPARKMGAGIG